MRVQQFIIGFLENWEQHRWRNHGLFWLTSFVLTVTLSLLTGSDFILSVVLKLLYIPIQIAATYTLVYYLLPKLLFRGKYLFFLILFIIASYILAVLARGMVVYIFEPIFFSGASQESWIEILTGVKAIFNQYLLSVYATSIFFLLLKYIKDSFLTRRKIQHLRKEKSITELNFLKSQVHPHFLFNTLNNIYVLTLRQSPEATGVVGKLADMMEYMLLTSTEERVGVGQEITLVQNYLDLERLRYGDRLDLSFNYKVENEQAQIAPLLLLSFVENAFKHGASGDILQPQIKIDLLVTNNKLSFKVVNSKNEKKQNDEQNYKKGIGVSNVKRQLDLIYKNQYQLNIDEQATIYAIDLQINLKEFNVNLNRKIQIVHS